MAATREFDDLASKEAGEIHKCFAERRLQVSLSQNLTLSCVFARMNRPMLFMYQPNVQQSAELLNSKLGDKVRLERFDGDERKVRSQARVALKNVRHHILSRGKP